MPYSGTEIARRDTNSTTCSWVNSSITAQAKDIDSKTNIMKKLVEGLEKGGGLDSTAYTTQGDGRWYNESFDGVTYIEATTTILVGFSVPGERTTVLAPKLCPPNSGTSDIFTKFYASQFKLQNNTNGNADYVVAQFTDVSTTQTVDIKLDNFILLFTNPFSYISINRSQIYGHIYYNILISRGSHFRGAFFMRSATLGSSNNSLMEIWDIILVIVISSSVNLSFVV